MAFAGAPGSSAIKRNVSSIVGAGMHNLCSSVSTRVGVNRCQQSGAAVITGRQRLLAFVAGL
jgi:hypothetical protein